MSEKTDKMLEEIDSLTVVELAELVKGIEEKYGVTAAAVAAPAAGAAGEAAAEKSEFNVVLKEAIIHSSDVFYCNDPERWINVRDNFGCKCVEMESFALFHNANVLGKKAACILTISDSFISIISYLI